jgi:hypothetical protein
VRSLKATKEDFMLWLLLGVILLVIAIAGGAIIHPVIFVLAILALIMFVTGFRGRGSAV